MIMPREDTREWKPWVITEETYVLNTVVEVEAFLVLVGLSNRF